MTVAMSLLLALPAPPAPNGDGARLSIEELLGLTALSTFLVGFANLRLQSQLNDWRASEARLTDRLLSENDQENLLPIPTSLRMSNLGKEFKIGVVPWYSLFLAIFFFSLSVFFSLDGWSTADGFVWSSWRDLSLPDNANYLAIHCLHLAILVLLLIEILITKSRAKSDEKRSIGNLFGSLERAIEAWRRSPTKDNQQKLIESCNDLSAQLPGWSWLTLIYFHLNPIDFNRKQEVLRLRSLACRPEVTFDTYSQIALVWSTYLIEFSHQLEVQRAEESILRNAERERHRTNYFGEVINSAIKDDNEGWEKGFAMPPPLDAPAWTSVKFETIERISQTSRDSLMSNYSMSNTSRPKEFGDAMANLAIDSWIRCLNLENCKPGELPEHLRQLLPVPNFCVGRLHGIAVIFSPKKAVRSLAPHDGERYAGLHDYTILDPGLFTILTRNPDRRRTHPQVRTPAGQLKEPPEETFAHTLVRAINTSTLNGDFGKNRTRAEQRLLFNLERNLARPHLRLARSYGARFLFNLAWDLARFGQIDSPSILDVLDGSTPIDCLDLWRHVKVIESRPWISEPNRLALSELSQWIIFHLQVGRK